MAGARVSPPNPPTVESVGAKLVGSASTMTTERPPRAGSLLAVVVVPSPDVSSLLHSLASSDSAPTPSSTDPASPLVRPDRSLPGARGRRRSVRSGHDFAATDVPALPQTLDPGHDEFPVAKPSWWPPRSPHPRRRAGGDHVTGLQRDDLRDVGDDLGGTEHQ